MALKAADWVLARSGVQVRFSSTKEALMIVFTGNKYQTTFIIDNLP